MPATWSDATDKQLLLAIIQLTGPKPPKWDQVAAMMGEGYTAESTRQHYAKLKTEISKLLGQPNGDGAGPKKSGEKPSTPNKTPAKRGKKAQGEDGTTTTKSGTKRKDCKDLDEDDENSPTKKTKLEKLEDADDDMV